MTATTTPGPAPVAGTVDPRTPRPATLRTTPTVASRTTGAAGTPRRMRLVGAVVVFACVVFGAIGALAAYAEARAVQDAKANAEQLVRIQTIDTNLMKADASATNAYLVGGLEPPALRQAYQDAISIAATALASASAANEADAQALGAANATLPTYTGLIESARANNRQGYPVGVAYVLQASKVMRDQIHPIMGKLITDIDARVTAANEAAGRAAGVMWASAAFALVTLILAQFWLLSRTKRVVNVGLALATLLVLVAAVTAGSAMSVGQQRIGEVRDGQYRATYALAQARTSAFDAKSNESLTLIRRGSGQEFEESFMAQRSATDTQLAVAVKAGVPKDVQSKFVAYYTVHTNLRKLDDAGNWDEAVQLATSNDAGGANAAFTSFDTTSKAALDAQATQMSSKLDEVIWPLQLASVIVLVAGLAAAGLAWWGIAKRLREYR